MEMMQHARSRFLGLDVHRDTIAVAVAEETGQPTSYSTIGNEPGAVRKLIQRLSGSEVRLIAAYEAGPTGYTLHRQLVKLGVACMVVAPSAAAMTATTSSETDTSGTRVSLRSYCGIPRSSRVRDAGCYPR